jgi:hypothetical protein
MGAACCTPFDKRYQRNENARVIYRPEEKDFSLDEDAPKLEATYLVNTKLIRPPEP